MIDFINKSVYLFFNPLGVTGLGILLAVILKMIGLFAAKDLSCRRRMYRVACILLGLTFIWLWVWSTKAIYKELGGWLERPYVKYADKAKFDVSGSATWGPRVEEYPTADAIVILGGGMSCHTNGCPYANMSSPADRVWHAVRLYRAGRAPLIISSGYSDLWSTKPLLMDFGIPESAMLFETDSVNTEQNAKFVYRLLHDRQAKDARGTKPRILLVTSAWHMRRSEFMFRKYAPDLDIIPAPTDFEATMSIMHPDGFRFNHLLPDPQMLAVNCAMFKEILGIVGYKLFR